MLIYAVVQGCSAANAQL